MKNHLTKIFFIFAALVCFSVTASAQKTDDNNKKGERNPPVIKPNEDRKPKNNDTPKDKDKDKKPQIIATAVEARVGVDIS